MKIISFVLFLSHSRQCPRTTPSLVLGVSPGLKDNGISIGLLNKLQPIDLSPELSIPQFLYSLSCFGALVLFQILAIAKRAIINICVSNNLVIFVFFGLE